MILLQQRTQPLTGGDSKQPEWRERFSTTRVDSATQAACSSSYTHVFRWKQCIFQCFPSGSIQTVCRFIFANILTHVTAGVILKSSLTLFRSSGKHMPFPPRSNSQKRLEQATHLPGYMHLKIFFSFFLPCVTASIKLQNHRSSINIVSFALTVAEDTGLWELLLCFYVCGIKMAIYICLTHGTNRFGYNGAKRIFKE